MPEPFQCGGCGETVDESVAASVSFYETSDEDVELCLDCAEEIGDYVDDL